MVKSKDIKTKDKALIMAYAISNKKGLHPVILDIANVSSLADYFVIASGKTEIQVRAIAQEIERIGMEKGIRILRTEGAGAWKWVLIDLGDVIVHIFKDSERSYYNLEALWKEAKKVSIPKL